MRKEQQKINTESLKKADNLFKLFGEIHNHIYANEGLSSQEAFGEFLKILFIKIQNEQRNNKSSRFYILEEELNKINDGKNSSFRQRIDDLFKDTQKNYSEFFSGNEKIGLKTVTLAFVVKKLQDFNFSQSDKDTKGIAFQKFVYSHQRGERGQFFTPDPVIKLCVEFINPQKNETIIDPACGTGGFLIKAMQYVWLNNFHNMKDKKKKEKEYVQKKIYGIEINPLIAKVAKMRMLFWEDGHAGIANADSLSKLDDLEKTFSGKTYLKQLKDSFDIVLTNPPFGSQGKIVNDSILKDFSLAYKWEKNEDAVLSSTDKLQNGQSPETLFIERCFDLLKDGGRLAIVLPNGIFENSSLGYVREYIKNKAKILGVVSLPPETFIPHGTGVKASILFAKKLSTRQLEKDHKVFFGKINKIGYEGNKNGTVIYKKNEKGKVLKDSSGRPIIDEDVSEIVNFYKGTVSNHKNLKQKNAFTINLSNLNERFDVEYHLPQYQQIKKILLNNGSVKLEDVAEVVSKKSTKLKNQENVIKYVELSDVNPFYGELVSCSTTKVYGAPSRASYDIENGDIITAVAGNSVGTKQHATVFVTSDFDGCVCTNGFRVLKCKKINPYYLFAFLKSDLFLSQMFQLRTGAAIPSVSDNNLKNILIPILSKEKQAKIENNVKKSLSLRKKSRDLLNQIKVWDN